MQNLYFFVAVRTLQKYLMEGSFDNQVEFLDALFESYTRETGKVFDNSLANKWMKGTAKLSPDICRFYRRQKHRQDLVVTLEDIVIPSFSDSAMAVRKIYELLNQDVTISEEKKQELCSTYSTKSPREMAVFLAGVLVFAMGRPVESVREPEVERSARMEGYFVNAKAPEPCPHFCGREQEIEELRQELISKGNVFIQGLPGIGKSELAKAYAKAYRDAYTNIFYLPFSGNLWKTIAAVTTKDDLPVDDENRRFQRNSRVFLALRKDSLLIIDNYAPEDLREELLSKLLKFRCHILITTRLCLPEKNLFYLGELRKREDLYQIASHFYHNADEYNDYVYEIIDALCSHTTAVELVAKLLEKGVHYPYDVIIDLKTEGLTYDCSEKLSLIKDGQMQEASLYEHMRNLFGFSDLSDSQREIMNCLSLVPDSGIAPKTFAEWMKMKNLNDVWELVERGFIIMTAYGRITMHPFTRQVALFETPPDTQNCKAFIRELNYCLTKLGYTEWDVLFQTTMNLVEYLKADDAIAASLFFIHAYESMSKHHYDSGLQRIYLTVNHISRSLTDANGYQVKEIRWFLEKYKGEYSDTIYLDHKTIQYFKALSTG